MPVRVTCSSTETLAALQLLCSGAEGSCALRRASWWTTSSRRGARPPPVGPMHPSLCLVAKLAAPAPPAPPPRCPRAEPGDALMAAAVCTARWCAVGTWTLSAAVARVSGLAGRPMVLR